MGSAEFGEDPYEGVAWETPEEIGPKSELTKAVEVPEKFHPMITGTMDELRVMAHGHVSGEASKVV